MNTCSKDKKRSLPEVGLIALLGPGLPLFSFHMKGGFCG